MVQIHHESETGWIITAGSAGPAGTIDLLLDTVRVSVDAIDPTRLVQLVAFDNSAAAVGAVRALVGDLVADQVQAGISDAEVAQIQGPWWPQLSGLAVAELAAQQQVPAQGLAALEVVRCGYEIGGICTALLRYRAWQALPAVAALGRAAGRFPDNLIDTLLDDDRELLATAIAALTNTLTADGWDGSGADAIRDLSDLLTRVPATPAPFVSESFELKPEFGGPRSATPRPISWQVSSDELRPRLGSLAAAAFTGATATGHVPGNITVQVPLRPDLAAGMPSVVVRALTWQGMVLSEMPLEIEVSPGQVGQGSCLLSVPELKDAGQLGAEDLTFDIALAVLPLPDADSLRRTARARAARAGKQAVLARRAGQRLAEARHWRRCAELLHAAGEPALARLAEDSVLGPAPATASWVDAVVERLLRLARAPQVPAGSASADEIEKQRLLVRDLSFATDAVTELVTAREHLAAMLRGGDEADLDEAAEQLSEALQVAYLLGDETAAARLLRTLQKLPDPETVR